MNRIRVVPYENAFKKAEKYSTTANWGLYLSAATSIAFLVCEQYKVNQDILDILNALSCLFIFIVFIFQILFSWFFFEASKSKRLDFIDNSMGSSFSTENSQGYFSNDNVPQGMYKLAVNSFENAFFTHRNSGKMVWGSWIKSAVIAFIFLTSAAMGERQIIVALFQISLPLFFMQESLMITQLALRTKRTFNDFAGLFNTLKNNPNLSHKEAEIIRLVLDYETIKAAAGIKTSSRFFKKFNQGLTQEWENIKIQYNI